jgi:hypothetical protein
MQELFSQAKRWYKNVQEAERIYGLLKEQNEPTPFLVALPFFYQRLLQKNEESGIADEKIVAFVGQYLSTRYPVLRDYFLGKEHRESVAEIRKTLDEFFTNDTHENEMKETPEVKL